MTIRLFGLPRRATMRLSVLASGALVGALLVAASPGSASAAGCATVGSQVTCTFSYNGTNGTNGSAQSFVVPPGVTQVTIQAWGASGPDIPAPVNGTGGLGGHAGATVPVTPGETLQIRVGSNRGFNSGNDGGGGATDVRQGGDTLTNRTVVAGGGGQGGGLCTDITEICQGFRGGAGGGVHGGDDGIGGAGGGGPTTGGFSLVGVPGSFGAGGNDGGGGGWYGGGGGGLIETGNAAGEASAGGGSGFVTPTATGPTINEAGINTGNGKATVSYTVPLPQGNIFATTFKSCSILHVGYNRFPNGTIVHWSVTTNGFGTVASGQFSAIGGGNLGSKTYHFLDIPLGTPLQPEPVQSHVHFSWTIGRTTTHYTVTRDPGCAATPRTGNAYVVCGGSHALFQYRFGAAGSLSPLSPASVPTGAPRSFNIAVARNGKSAYAPNDLGNSVGQYSIDPRTGGLSPMTPPTVPAGRLAGDIALSPDGRNAYVTNSGDDTVSQYSIDPTTGTLLAKTPATVPTGPIPQGVTVSPDGGSVYVTNDGGQLSSQYSINRSTGTLSPKTPATFVTGESPSHVAVALDGKSAYVTNSINDTVSQYRVNRRDGTLTPLTPATVTAGIAGAPGNGFVDGIVVTPDGRSVYVANSGGTVWQYNVDPRTGALAPKTQPNIASGNGSEDIAVSADTNSVYVSNAVDNTVSQYNIDRRTGALSPKTIATIATGLGPIGIALRPQP
jgi:6-phosphogluconolactonase